MLKRNKMRNKIRSKRVSSFRIIIFGFMSIILIGSLLLMLPISTRSGSGTGFIDALFTATSATCVTGLIVYDTATYWSLFGQAVILLLIQIGGMGIVTIAIAVTVFSGRKIGLKQRSTMQEAISAHHLGGIVRMTTFIFRMTLFFECIGAVLLFPTFYRDFGFVKGVWYSIFHSISAFCNAGFDLIGIKEPYSSLTSYAARPMINIVIMLLIVIGGIGFLTWDDIRVNKLHFRRYRMQSKMVLTVSAILIFFPAVYFFFGEFIGMPFSKRLLSSLFQSVTTRTAGFNTADLTKLAPAGLMLMIILMIIGGSPGSTAGGMKTTTVGVIFANAYSVFRKQEDAQIFGRRLSHEAIKNATTILLMYLVLFIGCGIIISRIDSVSLISAAFETASAIGTVGLTLGITPQLGTVSHLLLIMLMFFGRVGGLTLIFAALAEREKTGSKYPQEQITVG